MKTSCFDSSGGKHEIIIDDFASYSLMHICFCCVETVIFDEYLINKDWLKCHIGDLIIITRFIWLWQLSVDGRIHLFEIETRFFLIQSCRFITYQDKHADIKDDRLKILSSTLPPNNRYLCQLDNDDADLLDYVIESLVGILYRD